MTYAFDYNVYFSNDEAYVPGCVRTLEEADKLDFWCVLSDDFNEVSPVYQTVRQALLDSPVVVFVDDIESFDRDIMKGDPTPTFIRSDWFSVHHTAEEIQQWMVKWQGGNERMTLMVRKVYRIIDSVYIDYFPNTPLMVDFNSVFRLHLIDSFLDEN